MRLNFGPMSALVIALGASCAQREAAPPPSEEAPPTVVLAQTTADPVPADMSAAAADSGAPAPAASEVDAGRKPSRTPDVEYVPTPQQVVDKMLDLVKPKKTELLYDLGCGDGRIVVTAAKKYGVKAVGYDIDPQRVEEAKANVKKNGVEDLVTIEEKDIFTLDLSPANVVTLYLLPRLNVKLIPQLEKLKKGSRIVSHDFDMEGVKPDKHLKITPDTGGEREHQIYLFSVPLKKEKPKPAP